MRRMVIFVAAAGMALAAATAAQAVTLRYQGKANEVRRYTFAAAMRMKGEGEGESGRMEGTMTALLGEKITSVDEGVFTIEMKLAKGRMTMATDGEEPTKDTVPDSTTMTKIDAQGRITQYKPDKGGASASPLTGFGLGRAFAELGLFPERDLKVGESWSGDKEVQEQGTGTIKLHFTRTLVALEKHDDRDCAKIETKYHGTLEPSSGMMDGESMPGMDFSSTTSFAGTAVTWFDHQAGLVVEEDMTIKLVMATHFTIPATGAGEDVEHSSSMAMIMNTKTALQK